MTVDHASYEHLLQYRIPEIEHTLLKTLCDYDPARFKNMEVRFSEPVYPGETLRTEMWKNGNEVSFRCVVVERGKVMLNNGRAEIA